MKYPQLVSPRAVNAISDWLVSRLEQLGVESPQIYTRLLLSLLQSSVQVNDPIEFSNLEAFFANRKGGHKRFHLPSDTETLKKLNAVQCLREIVSNEQETATIEQLVDELCEKLKDIEKQTQDINNEERFLIATNLSNDSLPQTSNYSQQQQLQHQINPNSSSTSSNQHHPHSHHHHPQSRHYHQQQQQICNNSQFITVNNDSKRHHVSTSSTTDCLNDIDNDPKKRYFRAFPALSKEMEDSFRIWRRNAKSLTWPVVGRSINNIDNCNNNNNNIDDNNTSCAIATISSTNFDNSVSSDKIVEKKLKCGDNLEDNLRGAAIDISINSVSGAVGTIGSSDVQQGAVAAASVKKKSKRRRNQALCKGKTIQNIRKLTVGTTSNSIGGNKYHYTHHRNSSPPAWDTDFKGCWEMGPDLIKEFLTRQNANKKRTRSNSDSMDHEQHNERKILNEMPVEDDNDVDKPIMKRYIDISFCCDDDDNDDYDDEDDNVTTTHHHHHHSHYTEEEGVDYVDEYYDDDNTLASVSELVTDHVNPKRLYQREGHLQKSSPSSSSLLGCNVLIDNIDGDNTLDETSDSVDQFDFQQFKAKFNSSVEALWKDVDPITTLATNNQSSLSQVAEGGAVGEGAIKEEDTLKLNPLGISSAFYATTSLNALAPFKQDLWNFWSNYNQQQNHYDQLTKLSTTASTSSMITTRLDDSSASSGAGADIANSSDYFSMPSNLDDFDKSVGGVRRATEAGASLGAHTPSINVFLQNSIWSTSGDCVDAIGTSASNATTTADTDESFLFKVWHSNKKLSQLDVGNNNNNGEKMPSIVTTDIIDDANDFYKSKELSSSSTVNNTNSGANLQFTPYPSLKWSEGINAGPPYNSLRSNANLSNEMESLTSIAAAASTSLRADTNFAPFNTTVNITGATWEAPAYGQNSQPDLKSWCASNPISLTEMYGNDVCDSIVNQPTVEELEEEEQQQHLQQSEGAFGPAVTLPNHCANTSGFVSYARVKQYGLIQPQTKPLQSTNNSRLPKDFFRSTEEENLLTSERTHFHPIENFVDGHTFDICNTLDTIEFERSASGLMRYDSEEYLEYTRNDIYMADEEVASSTNLLKFGKPAKEEMFIIKFRVKRSGEIACQTEEEDFQLAAAKMAELPAATTPTTAEGIKTLPNIELPTTNMFSNAFAAVNPRQVNNEAIMAAVTKAVAAAAKAAAENRLNAGHFSWGVPSTISSTNTNTSSSLEANPIWAHDVSSICDEVDFCKANTLNPPSLKCSGGGGSAQLAQNWSMQEVEKQCHQRQHQQHEIQTKFPTSAVDIERCDDNSLDNSLHTLWGMCAVCNNCEYGKSMPANRLLRDELQLEADEIMSDLKYMQDLYIGETDILSEINTETDTDEYYETDKEKYNKNPKDLENIIKTTVTKEEHDPMQISMLQKVNQLIEDLLKPENSSKLPRQAEETEDCAKNFQEEMKQTELTKNVWMLKDTSGGNVTAHKSKNMWQFNEEQDVVDNIWQHDTIKESFDRRPPESEQQSCSSTIMKPMQLLKQVGDSFNEEQQYIEKLNWEHENLAKIWQQIPPPPPTASSSSSSLSSSSSTKIKQQIEECLMQKHTTKYNENLSDEEKIEKLANANSKVQEKNLKNLQTQTPISPTPIPPSSAATNTYKRVQQFLNTSAAKIKLAANRKRRHSASQNFYQHQNLQNINNNNNNNNDNITDLNSYKQLISSSSSDMIKNSSKDQSQPQSTTYNINPNTTTTLNMEEQQPTKQTIITCKYWTTSTNGTQTSMDSATAAMMLLAAATNAHNDNNMITTTVDQQYDPDEDAMLDENTFGNTFSCLIDKNASILKHVTMMTRPLTR